MRYLPHTIVVLLVVWIALPALALSPGIDLWVPAAAKAPGVEDSSWATSLYVYNPGETSVDVELLWLTRAQANPDPVSAVFTLQPLETLRLEDVVDELLGVDEATGAIRVLASGEVLAWARIENRLATGTYGQGLEAVPAQASVPADGWTEVLGIAHGTAHRSNFILVDTSGVGSEVELELIDDSGAQLAAGSMTLQAYEPILAPVTDLGVDQVASGTLRVHVVSGAVIALGARVDRGTGDPVTLESSWRSAGASEPTGTYYGSLIDALYPGGVILEMDHEGQVTSLVFTYPSAKLDCPYFFPAGGQFTTPIPLEDLLADEGVSWTQGYTMEAGTSGDITWTVTVDEFVANTYLKGGISATGECWTGWLSGACDGSFDTIPMRASKPVTD